MRRGTWFLQGRREGVDLASRAVQISIAKGLVAQLSEAVRALLGGPSTVNLFIMITLYIKQVLS